ncbi:MAG: 3-oxoacyl-[acyl-carrier-protein] synthase II [Marivirga sp.]|jgi:3-oxoacyl-[acyl-carrier-protein] synthase II
MKDQRVVITGMGTLNPLGNDIASFWENIVNGKSGADHITKFDTTNFKTKIACELKEHDLTAHLTRIELKRTDPYVQYALYAASQALEDAGISMDEIDPFTAGVIWGTGQGGLTTIEEALEEFHEENKTPHFNPLFIPKMLGNMASGMIALKFGFMGVNYTNQAACASANAAMMDAAMFIKQGKAKFIVVGGSDAPITPATVGGFNALRALSTKNDSPATASKPFDELRDGFVLSEGAAALILEDYEHAKARGATIYAELVGTAITNDAYHMTAGHPKGVGAIRAMNDALKEADISAESINYLNPHATSTPVGDAAEGEAINKVWHAKGEKLKISATKSMTGHHLGAAGAIEAIICIQSILHNCIPPTINSNSIDSQTLANFQFIRGQAVTADVTYAMNNSFGFGGHNAVSIFKEKP